MARGDDIAPFPTRRSPLRADRPSTVDSHRARVLNSHEPRRIRARGVPRHPAARVSDDQRDRVVHAGALLGAAAGGAIVGGAGARSSAYLPLPVAVAISDEPAALAAAALAAFAVPFAVTLCRRH